MARYKVKLINDKESGNDLVRISWKQMGKLCVSRDEYIKIAEGDIEGVFVPEIVSNREIIYTANAFCNIENYLFDEPSVHKLFNFIARLNEIQIVLNNQGLQVSKLFLDKRYVFVNQFTGMIYFVYEPLEGVKNPVNIYSFVIAMLDDLLFMAKSPELTLLGDEESQTNSDKRRGKKRTIKMSKELRAECIKFRKFIGENKNRNTEAVKYYITNNYPQIYQEVKQNLQDENKKVIFLIRIRTGQKIPVYKDEIIIGKDSACDVRIDDNSAISRHHSRIYIDNRKYYIMDMESKNKTYHMGKEVNPNESVEILDGDRIKLADEEFEVHII